MTIDFAKIAKKVASSALVAMGTGVFGMIGGGLVKLGLGALNKDGSVPEIPDAAPDAIEQGATEMTDAIEVDMTPEPDVQADVDVELPTEEPGA